MTSPTLKQTASGLELEDVVPVTTCIRPGDSRAVLGVELQPLDLGERIGQHGALEDFGHDMFTLEPGGVGERNPGTACHFGGQRHVIRLESPARPVEEGHDADDLAVGRERHGQGGRRPSVALVVEFERCQLCPPGPVRQGGRGIRVVGHLLAAQLAEDGAADIGAAHVEPDKPGVGWYLHDAGIGQAALDEAHGAPDDRGGLQARTEQPGHLGEQGEALPGRFGGAEGLTFVLEHLGPFERLGSEGGQRGQEADVGTAQLGIVHEGQ